MVAGTPLALDAYLPALPVMADYFAVDIVAMNNTISTFLLGNALGVLLGGPVSDCIGRRKIGLTGLILFMLTAFGIVFATTVVQIQVLRFIQAIGTGMATVVCLPSIRDVYDARETGSKFALVMMIMSLAPLVAPVLGAILLHINWQAIFVALGIYAGLLAVWYAIGIRETRKGPVMAISPGAIFSRYLAVITYKTGGRYVASRYALSMSLTGGVLMTFLTNASFAYIQYFGVSEIMFPVLFGASPVAMMLTNFVSMKLIRTHNPQSLYKGANLMQLLIISLLVCVVFLKLDSLFTVVPLIVMGISMGGIIYPCGSTMYMSNFRELSGSASSIATTGMFILGAGFGALSGVFFDGSLKAMAGTMLAATLLANLVAWSIPATGLEDKNHREARTG